MGEPPNEGPEKAAKETKESEVAQEGAQAEPGKVGDDMDRLRADLEAREKRIDELSRAYSALLNDQKDFRARLEREKERVLETERGKIAMHLLAVGDELERALDAAKAEKGPLAAGVRMIYEGLGKTYSQLGIERLSLVGAAYDANLAEVVDVVPVQDKESDGVVVSEVAPGFRVGEKVIRAARVRVGRLVPAAQQPGQPPDGQGG